MVGTADSVLIREVSFIQSVLYIQVPLYTDHDVQTCILGLVLACGLDWEANSFTYVCMLLENECGFQSRYILSLIVIATWFDKTSTYVHILS